MVLQGRLFLDIHWDPNTLSVAFAVHARVLRGRLAHVSLERIRLQESSGLRVVVSDPRKLL